MASKAEEAQDLTYLFTYYDSSRKLSSAPEIGQVVFTPVTNMDKKPQIADAKRSNPETHAKAEIVVRPADDKIDFLGKPGRLPIYAISLGETEEIIMTRAKKRPCVILAKTDGVNHQTLPSGPQQNKALNAFNTAYLLAPIYSVSTPDKARSFGPVMTARIRGMMYPEFVFVPQSGGVIKHNGVIRLDRTFWSHMNGASQPQPLFLSNEILGVCWNQIRILSNEQPDDEYLELRDILLEYLPEDCK